MSLGVMSPAAILTSIQLASGGIAGANSGAPARLNFAFIQMHRVPLVVGHS